MTTRGLLLVVTMLAAATFQSKPAPDRAEAARLNNIGVALMNQQLMEKAVEKFDEALRRDPGLTVAELNKGIALLNLQKLPQAALLLKRAAAGDPRDPRAWYNLGLVYRGTGENEQGIAQFRKVLELDPQDADAHYFIGALYLQQQQPERAIPEFEAALRLNRLHASAEFGLARALQRLGKAEAAREHLHTFEHLTREKISLPLTLAYGEQGRYSAAEDVVTGKPSVAPMVAMKFVAQPLGPAAKLEGENAIGGGACLLDVNGDSRMDVIDLNDGINVFLNEGEGRFKQAPAGIFAVTGKSRPVSCAVGDFDNDGRDDLAVAFEDRVVLYHNAGGGKFIDITKAAGIEPRNQPAGMTFVDFDHDGDLDLFIAGRALPNGTGPNVLWRNNGNGSFTDWTKPAGLAGAVASMQPVLSDLNNDRAVDLIVAGAGPAPVFYANQREGQFAASALTTSTLPPSVGIVAFDFNKDGWMDLAITHTGAPGLTLWKNVDGKHFEPVPLPLQAKQGWGIAAVDVDNDGWIDLAAVVEIAGRTEVRVLRNLGDGKFADVSGALGLDRVQLQNARALLEADLDGDGDSDLLVTELGAAPVMLRNDGGNQNHFLRISLQGRVDNKSALGTKVEVFADGLWQKWEITGSSGYLSSGSNEILAGLGSETRVDVVRMLWPTGVLQDEIEVGLNKPVVFTELDRRGSSCPTLFAWNGEKYEFIADVIGAAVVGHWISPTEKNIGDSDEWVKIEGTQLKARDGVFSLRFGEPMEEVNFLDQIRLVAVDHPEGTEVYPNERFLSAPPFPEEKTIVTSAPRPPAGAWDDHGRDVREELRARDRRYVRNFRNLSFSGFANPHVLTLDLGSWTPAAPLRLYLHGFIEYFTATSMYAAWQAGITPVAPYVEAQLADGSWKRVIDDMGFPAGLARTIVVDLTGKLPAGARKIRIGTNLQIYWDQVLVDNGPDRRDARITELPLRAGRLAFRGYPQQVEREVPGDLTYVYERVSKTGPFSRPRGTYTRYGEVTTLLTKVDNHYVIFGSGEEIAAEFSAAALPPLRHGWRRDYFFYANGFVKDMDFYEASPLTVSELPFHGMTAYPYPASEHYPDDPESVAYRLNWNDRFDSGKTGASEFRFHYEVRKP